MTPTPTDAAVAQAFRDVMNGPFDIDAIYFVNAVNARARELDTLRNPEADAGDPIYAQPTTPPEVEGVSINLSALGAACDAYYHYNEAAGGEPVEYFPDAMEAAINAFLRHPKANPPGEAVSGGEACAATHCGNGFYLNSSGILTRCASCNGAGLEPTALEKSEAERVYLWNLRRELLSEIDIANATIETLRIEALAKREGG